MIRLNPTRLELRIEDLSEFAEIKNKFETEKKARDDQTRNMLGIHSPNTVKAKQDAVQERIGFVPRPRHSSQ